MCVAIRLTVESGCANPILVSLHDQVIFALSESNSRDNCDVQCHLPIPEELAMPYSQNESAKDAASSSPSGAPTTDPLEATASGQPAAKKGRRRRLTLPWATIFAALIISPSILTLVLVYLPKGSSNPKALQPESAQQILDVTSLATPSSRIVAVAGGSGSVAVSGHLRSPAA